MALTLLGDDRHVRATVSVITPVDTPILFRWIRREGMAER